MDGGGRQLQAAEDMVTLNGTLYQEVEDTTVLRHLAFDRRTHPA